MKIRTYIAIGVLLALAYLFAMPFFYLGIFIIVIYILLKIKKWVDRIRTPKGMRIKHNLLKGYLDEKYGKDGKVIYTNIVKELKGKGYR